MKHQRSSSSPFLFLLLLLTALVSLLPPGFATAQQPQPGADDTPKINQAIVQKNWANALEQLDARIAAQPRDVQAKFKRATMLARLGRDHDAMTAYTALTEQYPELPEPYNNLAVLYVRRGNLEKARALLETAVAANPNFTLAYRNLGDLYLLLSSQAYQRAAAAKPPDALAAARQQQILRLIRPAPAQSANRIEDFQ